MERLVEKLNPEKYSVMQWHTQTFNIATNLKVKVYFALPALIATHFVTWEFHVDDSSKGWYDIILRRYLLTELELNLELSDHIIKADDRNFKESTTHMVDLGMYAFKGLNTEKITSKEQFTNAYVE